MGGHEQKEAHFPVGSILEERIVRLGLVHNPRVPCSWLVIVYEKRRDRDGRTTVIVVRARKTTESAEHCRGSGRAERASG